MSFGAFKNDVIYKLFIYKPYIYVYLGSISSLMQISLNIIDIFDHIGGFFLIA